MQSSSITKLNLSSQPSERFPTVPRSRLKQNQQKLMGFENFIFHDNYTGNKIVIKQLDDLYSRRKERRIPHKKRNGEMYGTGQMGHIVKSIQEGINMLTNTRKFQMDSIRRRDTRYLLPTLSQTLPTKTQAQESSRFEEQDRECSRLSMKIYQSNKSNFRQYLQKEKLPSPRLMKLASMDVREKRMTKYQQFKMMRISKLLLLEQQHRDEAQMEYEYRKEQSEQFNLANMTNLQNVKPMVNQARDSIKDDYFKNIQTEFMSRINFYVKRTIQQNGQYLIEPSIQELQRLNLLKKISYDKENQRQNQRKQPAQNEQNEAQTLQIDDETYKKALQVSKLLRREDKRTQLQKDFVKAIRRNDLFDVGNMLNKNPNLINTKDWRGNNPMHQAAKIGDNEMFYTLFEKGGKIYQLNQTAVNICQHFSNTHVLEYIGIQNIRK